MEKLVKTFPKKAVKKYKARGNPRPMANNFCIICGKPYAELHEVFGGKNRQKSIEWGMQIRLCAYHHRNGKMAVHRNPEFDFRLKQKYQEIFENEHGPERFMQEFGENYRR